MTFPEDCVISAGRYAGIPTLQIKNCGQEGNDLPMVTELIRPYAARPALGQGMQLRALILHPDKLGSSWLCTYQM